MRVLVLCCVVLLSASVLQLVAARPLPRREVSKRVINLHLGDAFDTDSDSDSYFSTADACDDYCAQQCAPKGNLVMQPLMSPDASCQCDPVSCKRLQNSVPSWPGAPGTPVDPFQTPGQDVMIMVPGAGMQTFPQGVWFVNSAEEEWTEPRSISRSRSRTRYGYRSPYSRSRRSNINSSPRHFQTNQADPAACQDYCSTRCGGPANVDQATMGTSGDYKCNCYCKGGLASAPSPWDPTTVGWQQNPTQPNQWGRYGYNPWTGVPTTEVLKY